MINETGKIILVEAVYISHNTDTLEKGMIELLSLHLTANRADWVLLAWDGNRSRRKTLNSNWLNSVKIDIVSYSTRA